MSVGPVSDSDAQLGRHSPLEVVPLVGVPPLRFGMSVDEVASVLGEPRGERDGASYYVLGSRLRADFPDGKVVFVEISWLPGAPAVIYRGVSVFDTPADELVEHISGERPDREDFEFTDFELDLGLWRPMLPSDYEPTEPEDEYRNGRYWMTIAIGSGGYFRESARARQMAAIRERRSPKQQPPPGGTGANRVADMRVRATITPVEPRYDNAQLSDHSGPLGQMAPIYASFDFSATQVPNADYTVTITWGDGTSCPVDVPAGTGEYRTVLVHGYALGYNMSTIAVARIAQADHVVEIVDAFGLKVKIFVENPYADGGSVELANRRAPRK